MTTSLQVGPLVQQLAITLPPNPSPRLLEMWLTMQQYCLILHPQCQFPIPLPTFSTSTVLLQQTVSMIVVHTKPRCLQGWINYNEVTEFFRRATGAEDYTWTA